MATQPTKVTPHPADVKNLLPPINPPRPVQLIQPPAPSPKRPAVGGVNGIENLNQATYHGGPSASATTRRMLPRSWSSNRNRTVTNELVGLPRRHSGVLALPHGQDHVREEGASQESTQAAAPPASGATRIPMCHL